MLPDCILPCNLLFNPASFACLPMPAAECQGEICKECFVVCEVQILPDFKDDSFVCVKLSYSTWILTGNVLVPQVMRIVDNVRPDRQTVMFSATFPRAMEALARRILSKPIEVQVGGRSVVCSDVEQHVVSITHLPPLFSHLLAKDCSQQC